jgi:hypothetical protein
MSGTSIAFLVALVCVLGCLQQFQWLPYLLSADGVNPIPDHYADHLLARFVDGIANFFLSSITVTIGIIILVVVVWVYRVTIGEGALDVFGIAEQTLGLVWQRSARTSVNVEYRAVGGKQMNLGPYIQADARASRGWAYALRSGFFVDCDREDFTPGALVSIDVQGGLVREELVIQVDFDRNMLFVQSNFTFAQLVAKIHRLT